MLQSTSCTNQHSTTHLGKTWGHLQTKTGASRGVSAWCRAFFGRREIAPSFFCIRRAWRKRWGGTGNLCTKWPAVRFVLCSQSKCQLQKHRQEMPDFTLRCWSQQGLCLRTEVSPKSFCSQHSKCFEPATTHLLLSNSETNCDFCVLAYESSSRAELHWNRQAYDSVSERRIQASFIKANPKIPRECCTFSSAALFHKTARPIFLPKTLESDQSYFTYFRLVTPDLNLVQNLAPFNTSSAPQLSPSTVHLFHLQLLLSWRSFNNINSPFLKPH